MGVTTTKTNKPLNPRGNDQSPLAFNRAKLYSGKALDFDGVNDYVDCGTLDVTGYTQITFSTYLNIDTLVDQRIVSLRHSGGDDLRIFTATGKGNVIAFATDDTTPVTIETPLTFNEWFHVVMTHDGTTLTAYINGQEAVSAASDFNYSTADGELFLGAWSNGSPSLYYDGEMAGFKAFNTALTAAQVADLYNNPEKIVPTGVEDTALKLWLPMMEGAGTTAYDGSGNGNHGTISGATYVNGVGAPVAQSAVMDWNKGTNLLTYSEEIDNAIWQKVSSGAGSVSPIATANYGISPDGTQTAERIQLTRGSGASAYSYVYQSISVTSGQTYSWSVWLKSLSGTPSVALVFDGSSYDNIVTLTNEWAKYTFTGVTGGAGIQSTFLLFGDLPTTSLTADFLAWGAQVNEGSAGPYIPTIGTAQTTPVLLPQGLTSGRDITGVNLFENVRKQGALNLDGNSWAEVHDNASLDITSAITLEAWVKWDIDGVQNKGILGKWGSSAGYLLYKSLSTRVNFFINGNSSLYISLTNGWNHIVGTYDGANRKIYINGALEETDADTSTITESALNVEIGTYGGFGSSAYDQPIAQPRIYNRALTAEEVLRNYNSGKNTYK